MNKLIRNVFICVVFFIAFSILPVKAIDKIGFYIDEDVARACFNLLKNVSPSYGFEIPLEDFDEFKENATLYFTRSNIYHNLKVGEGFYFWLVYQFGNKTKLRVVSDIYEPRENVIIFYYDSTGFEGCGISKIKKGAIERSRYLTVTTLWEGKYPFELIVLERNFIKVKTRKNVGYHGKILLLIFKGSEAYKLRVEAIKKNELIKKIIFTLPIIVLIIIFIYWYKTRKSSKGV